MEEQKSSAQTPETSPVVSSRPRTTPSSDAAGWAMVAGIAGHLAWIIAIPVLLFVLGGAWLDKYLGTTPLFLLIGFPLSMVVAVMGVRSVIKKLPKN